MRTVTALALLVIVAALAGAGAFAVVQGDGGSLDERWVSDTGRDMKGNHHAPAVATVDGHTFVFTPISDRGNGNGCGLYALNATDGGVAWEYQVPPANCTLHAVADPTVADYDGDGDREVLATSTEEDVNAFDPVTGETEMRHELRAYGYTQPVVANLSADPGTETAVVDVKGYLRVVRADGTAAWTRDLGGMVWGQPTVDDVDTDGDPELVAGVAPSSGGRVVALDGNGSVEWTTDVGASILWMGSGQTDDDAAVETVVATSSGHVVAVDGRDGTVEWRRDVGDPETDAGDLSAVDRIVDGDGDGTAEVYAASADGTLYALDGTDGSVEWSTSLTSGTKMMPPPAVGDVDGDGDPELVAVTNDGTVAVVAPDSGEVRATYSRSVPIYTHPTLADVDGDGAEEIHVIYGDARLVSLSFSS